MNNKEKLFWLEEMMELDEGSLSEETLLSALTEWDSVTAISLIVQTEEKFGKELTADVIRSFKTIGDILIYLG